MFVCLLSFFFVCPFSKHVILGSFVYCLQLVLLLVGSAGGKAKMAPLKGLVRVCEKAVLEYQRLLQRLVDILRAQIRCATMSLAALVTTIISAFLFVCLFVCLFVLYVT